MRSPRASRGERRSPKETNIDITKLHTNQRLLVEELQKRKVNIEIVDIEIELLHTTYGNHVELLLDRYSSIFPYPITKISSDKILSKKLLKQAGLIVPEGRLFVFNDLPKALEYADELGFPLVIKPNWGSHGDCVYINITDEAMLLNAIHELLSIMTVPFIIEKHVQGKEYRVFITSKGDYAVIHRDPAHVIGDDRATIRELAENESARRKKSRATVLSDLVIDNVAQEYLARSKKSLDYIPFKNEKVYIRDTSNVAKGATCEDYTDKMHKSVLDIARKALAAFPGLPYAGIDLLSTDITVPQTPDKYSIVEINANPGFALHMRPGSGTPRNVAGWVADMIFPEAVV